MSTSITEFTAKLPIALLRTLMFVVGLMLALLWSTTSVRATHPNDPNVVCGEDCYLPSVSANVLYLPVLARVPQPVTPPTIVDPQPVWTAEWWQWLERTANAPVMEEGDVDCGRGQSGSVWFLAGANDNLPKTRNCTVPSGITLLAPLFTIVFYNSPGESYTLEEKRNHLNDAYSNEVAGLLNTELCGLESTIDGRPFDSVRLQSPPFVAQGDPEALADGYYLAFQLAPGEHQIHFVGVLCQFGTEIEAYVVDITYTLTVVEMDQYQNGASVTLTDEEPSSEYGSIAIGLTSQIFLPFTIRDRPAFPSVDPDPCEGPGLIWPFASVDVVICS